MTMKQRLLAASLLAGPAMLGDQLFGAEEAAAQLLPDFTINRADSTVWGQGEGGGGRNIGCRFEDFLSQGFIAIKNIGEGSAPRLPPRVVTVVRNLDGSTGGIFGPAGQGGPIENIIGGVGGEGGEERRGGPIESLLRGDGELGGVEREGEGQEGEGGGQTEPQQVTERRLVSPSFIWAQVYNPFNPDLSYYIESDRIGPEELGSLDQERFPFFLGAGQVKKYRNFTGQVNETITEPMRITPGAPPRLIDIQRALHVLGYAVEPDGVVGPSTEQAIEQFQTSIGGEATGELTEPQSRELIRMAMGGRIMGGARGPNTMVDIFVVVDPLDLIEESNESNNIQMWRVQIDCSIEDVEALRP